MNKLKFNVTAEGSLLTSNVRRVLDAQIRNLEELVGNLNQTISHLKQQTAICDIQWTQEEVNNVISEFEQSSEIVIVPTFHAQAVATIHREDDGFIITPIKELPNQSTINIVINSALSEFAGLNDSFVAVGYILFTAKQSSDIDNALNAAMKEAELEQQAESGVTLDAEVETDPLVHEVENEPSVREESTNG